MTAPTMKRRIDNDDHYKGGNNVQYIVMHDTGNYKDTDEGNANFFCTGSRNSSAHYFVDEDSITQVVEEWDCAWHCGDGHGKYGISNRNSLGIEMCNSGGYIAEATIQNTIWLVKRLQAKYGIDNDHVVRHYDASRKNCPANMSANNWAKWWEFKKRLAGTDVASCTTTNTSSDYGIAVVKAKSGLNVRSGASTSSPKIGTLKYGQEIRVHTLRDGWADTYYGSHGGYVSAEFLDFKEIFKKPEPPKPTTAIPVPQQTFFRVIVGSYTERANAEDMQAKLKANGFDSFLASIEKDGQAFLRVICDSYTVRANAEARQSELKAKGFDSFLEAFTK